MNILFLVSASGNPLYDGQYNLHGRYMTFGQQSFIFDLLAGLVKNGVAVTVGVEDANRFPLIESLRRLCRVIDPHVNGMLEDVDLVLFDEGSDRLLAFCPTGVPAFRIVHNAAMSFSAELERRCQRFICLTERSLQRLSTRMPSEKLVLIHQGVDLDRFVPQPRSDAPQVRVLIYSRLDANREPTIWNLLEQLERSDVRVTLLGDGPKFWGISDRFGGWVTPVLFIPCLSIQNFLPHFDVVISSARGVMEALAMGLPALCGGYEYAGPVLRDTIRDHLKVNITGVDMGTDPRRVREDVHAVTMLDASTCRALAEDFCSVQGFIDRLFQTLDDVQAAEIPTM